jgi:glycerophosphoryl diester phosphodiesterase
VASTANAALHCHYQSLTDQMLLSASQLAVPVLAYTVNDPDTARKLINAGIFGLFSDNPQQLRHLGTPVK